MTTPTLELIFSELEFAGSGWFSQIRSHIVSFAFIVVDSAMTKRWECDGDWGSDM